MSLGHVAFSPNGARLAATSTRRALVDFDVDHWSVVAHLAAPVSTPIPTWRSARTASASSPARSPISSTSGISMNWRQVCKRPASDQKSEPGGVCRTGSAPGVLGTERCPRGNAMKHPICGPAAALVTLSASLLPAQTELYSVRGTQPTLNLGHPLCVPGDLDGDGFDDFVSGTGLGRGPIVRAYSGRTGQLLHEFVGQRDESFGSAISGAGDVNADGFADFALGARKAGDRGFAQIISGQSGHALYTRRDEGSTLWGTRVSAAGDANRDGFDDVFVGRFAHGRVRHSLISGRDGTVLSTEVEERVHGVGDFDHDGADDFAVVLVDLDGSTRTRCLVYSSLNRRLLLEITDPAPSSALTSFGETVAAGDVNGDGHRDLVVGAPYQNTAPPLGGVVYAFSGSDRRILIERISTNVVDHLGTSIAVADLDGDGRDDVIAGAPAKFPSPGYVIALAFDGTRDGETLALIPGDLGGDKFGHAVAAGDVTGDGRANLIVGAPTNDDIASNSGKITVFEIASSIDPGRQVGYGAPCQDAFGRVPRMSIVSRSVVGEDLEILLRSSPFLAQGVLFLGHDRAAVPLAAIGMPSCTLLTTPALDVSLRTSTNGRGSRRIPLPDDAALIGARFAAQAFLVDVAANTLGFVSSGAVEITLGGG